MESMSSNHRLIELGGARFAKVPTCPYFGGWEGHSNMIVVAKGPKRAFRVFATQGFSPCQVTEVPIGLALRRTNVIFYRASSLLTPGWSRSFRPTTPGGLVKALPQIAACNCPRGTLHSQGRMPC